MLKLGKFSFGMGDRFAHQAVAQLRACLLAREAGVDIVPVWNKSNREHTTIGSEPQSVRAAADAATRTLGWTGEYHIDADHINLTTVDRFIAPSDFFTIDVAAYIGKEADPANFVQRHPELVGEIQVPGLGAPLRTTAGEIRTQLRLPQPLHIWLRQHCKQHHRSMNGQIVEIIEAAKRHTEAQA
jgi:hypothetical protein